MNISVIHLLLADDDLDDCSFFKDALDDLPLTYTLKTVNDGVQLLNFLDTHFDILPDIIFLDLNMPRKSGIECLSEIKKNDKWKHLPVIIFSTSLDIDIVNLLYQNGAHLYIRKPGEFFNLKKVISEAVTRITQNNSTQPPREQFVIHP